MSRQTHKTFIVNGSTYTLEKMRADMAYRLGLKLLGLLRRARLGTGSVLSGIALDGSAAERTDCPDSPCGDGCA